MFSPVNSLTMIDLLMEPFNAPAPGAALAVIRDGVPVVTRAWGNADLARGLPCSVKTNFRLASLSKAFTAMAVLLLAERGLLSLDAPLSNYFSALPPWGRAITPRHLLAHLSGLWDYEDLMSNETTSPLKDRDVLALLERQDATYFPPGAGFRYSNTGYAFLALIVAAVSGQTFAEFLRDHIFRPLAMNYTVAFENGVSTISNRSLGYTMTPAGAIETDQDLTSSVLGDGGIYSSVTGLLQWDRAFYTEKLVSAETLRQIFTPWSKTSDVPGSGYGFGWYLTQKRGVECQWHYGSTCGFSSWIERYPSENLTVILLANRRDAGLGEIVRRIVETMLK